jgi:sugar lactone lactonase YvrE
MCENQLTKFLVFFASLTLHPNSERRSLRQSVLKEKKLKLKRFEFAVATALVVLLAGCGGGGGGGGGGSTGTPTSPTGPTSPATQYTLGGTVSGLPAGAIVTIGNGADKKIISANGPFTMDVKLNAGASYNLDAAPSPGYTCQIANGSGTINANVTNATVTCGPVAAIPGIVIAGQIAGYSTALKEPLAVVADGAGNVYVADAGPHSILKMSKAGQISTLAGKTGKPGTTDGGADGAQFWLGGTGGLALDAQGNLFVSDGCNGEIRKVAADGTVSTLAGSGSVSCNNVATTARPNLDGSGTSAVFQNPGSMVADGNGGVIVLDSGATATTVRRVSAAGVVTTTTYANPDPVNSTNFSLQRIARGADGTLYFSDGTASSRIWKDVGGSLVLVAGRLLGTGSIDGTGADARFSAITGMTVVNGDMYVTDLATVRKVTLATGAVSTLAGSNAESGRGFKNGQGTAAMFGTLLSITFDGTDLVVVDAGQEILRKVSLTGTVTTPDATPALRERTDGTGTAARFGSFSSLAAGADGNLYSVDPAKHVVRMATPAGVVSTISGTGASGKADGALASATFATPQRIAAGSDGSLWIAQSEGVRRIFNGNVSTPNATIRPINLAVDPRNGDAIIVTGAVSGEVVRLTAAGVRTTIVTRAQIGTVVGRANPDFRPQSVAVDAAGNIYIADTGTVAVYKLTPQGQLSLFAGTPFVEAGNRDGAPGTATLGFYEIDHMTIDNLGNLYLSGQGSVRKISPAGIVSTPTYVWGNADIGAVAFLNGKLYAMTRYALLQSDVPAN